MSSAMNHKRRSHRSELRKEGMYRASMRRVSYSAGGQKRRFEALRGFLRMLRRAGKNGGGAE